MTRYGAEDLPAQLGPGFEPLSAQLQTHETPAGAEQQFLYSRHSSGGAVTRF